jgi:hypothetical protein
MYVRQTFRFFPVKVAENVFYLKGLSIEIDFENVDEN